MRIPQRRIASALFSSAAVALLGFWYIYLFVGIPERQSAPEHALSLLAFSFAESGAPWHFARGVAGASRHVAANVMGYRNGNSEHCVGAARFMGGGSVFHVRHIPSGQSTCWLTRCSSRPPSAAAERQR
jgi:hypothetical protein